MRQGADPGGRRLVCCGSMEMGVDEVLNVSYYEDIGVVGMCMMNHMFF